MDKKPITPEGHKRLKDELDYIKNIKRQDIIDAISEARAHGDLKENAEYHAAREEQGLNEARIREFEDALSILLRKKLKVSFKPSDLTETPFEFEKIRSQKESKQAEDDLKKDSSLNEMLEKFDGKIKKVSKI